MCEPTVRAPLAIATSEELASLSLVIWRDLLLLSVEKLAVLPSKTSARGGVVPAHPTSFGGGWSLRHHDKEQRE